MTQKVLFNIEECDFLKSVLLRDDIVKTTNAARGSFNTTVGVVPPNDIPKWFTDKISIFNINNISFQNKLAVSRSVIINKYGEGGYFLRHRDDYNLKKSWTYRYKTLIVQLSESNTYIGGNLLIDDKPVNREVGNTILFDASTYHELTTITNGNRYSLILWLDRDDITENRNIL